MDAHPSLQSTFGWLFLAVVVGSILYGASLIQFFSYTENFWKTDNWYIKYAVSSVMIFDTLHQILLLEPTFEYFVKDFGNFDALQINNATLMAIGIPTAFNIATVQYLLVQRVWRLSNKNKALVAVLSAFVLSEFVMIMLYYSRVKNAHFLADLANPTTTTIEKIMNGSAALTDVSLATTLVLLLRRSRSGFEKSDTVVKRLVIYTLSTSLVTAFAACMIIVTLVALPKTFVYLALNILMAKFYVACMFVSLNSRHHLKTVLTRPRVISLHPTKHHAPIQVMVSRAVESDRRTINGDKRKAVVIENMGIEMGAGMELEPVKNRSIATNVDGGSGEKRRVEKIEILEAGAEECGEEDERKKPGSEAV